MNITDSDIFAKALLLHYGVSFRQEAMKQLDSRYMMKRRVYSNYDEGTYCRALIPPEVLFPESGLTATVISKQHSPLHIDYQDSCFFLTDDANPSYKKKIDFLPVPSFYGKKLKCGENVEQHITKLFGHTLGVFANTKCFFAEVNQACRFCSIKANIGRPIDFSPCATVDKITEAIEIALSCDESINCIFISGGVCSGDFDNNFIFYANLAKEIKRKVNSIKRTVEVTLNAYPPEHLELLCELKSTGIAFMLSVETISAIKRSFYCPGKEYLFNSIGVRRIIEKLVSVAGYGRVLAFVIEGLEDKQSISKGAELFAQQGACVVAHVLHVDPGTWVEKSGLQPPSVAEIIDVTHEMSSIYHKYGFDTSILYGGRSSLDAEASLAIF